MTSGAAAARNLRRASVPESVIMRMGGWKTRSMFDRYNVVDESDLADAADAYDAFLDRAAADRKVVALSEAKSRATASQVDAAQDSDILGSRLPSLRWHANSKSPARKGVGPRLPSSAVCRVTPAKVMCCGRA
jgi:hypothetical protein